MQIKDLFSDKQLTALRSKLDEHTLAEKYASNVGEIAHKTLYAIASDHKHVLNASFWQELGAEFKSGCYVAVLIKGKSASIFPECNSPRMARMIGDRLKQGYGICVITPSGWAQRVTWENWKRIYAMLTRVDNGYEAAPSEREIRNITTKRKKEAEFYEAASCIRNKKLGKRGFNMTFDELRAQMRQEAYERNLRTVTNTARTIMAVL